MGVFDLRIRLKYFAILREQRGLSEESVSTTGRTVAELYDELASMHRFSLKRPHVRAAVNGAFVNDDHSLQEDDLVVFIPPMAGG